MCSVLSALADFDSDAIYIYMIATGAQRKKIQINYQMLSTAPTSLQETLFVYGHLLTRPLEFTSIQMCVRHQNSLQKDAQYLRVLAETYFRLPRLTRRS